ncbi:MAG: hypothetical protein ACREPE_14185, partial [Lysobacter sp.]
MARAAASAVVGSLTSYAANKAVGNEAHFSWKAIAASALTAVVTAAVMPTLGETLGINLSTTGGQVASDLLGGAVGGVVGLHMRRAFGLGGEIDYGQLAVDVFGNMLANAAAGNHGRWAVANSQSPSASGGGSGGGGGDSVVGFGKRFNRVDDDVDHTFDPVKVTATRNAAGGWDNWIWSQHNNRWVDGNRAILEMHNGHLDPVVQRWSKPREQAASNAGVQHFIGQLQGDLDRSRGFQPTLEQRFGLQQGSPSVLEYDLQTGKRIPQMRAFDADAEPRSMAEWSAAKREEQRQNRAGLDDTVGNMLSFFGPRRDNGFVNGQLVNPINGQGLSVTEQQTAMMDVLGIVPLGGAIAKSSVGRVANGARAEMIAESRAQSALLREKFGALSPEQRAARIDELSRLNYERRIGEAINSQEYVFRYLSEDGLNTSLRYGSVRGYTTTEFSHSSSAVANGAQILPEWGVPQYGVAIPVDKLNGFSLARPMGNRATMGWEPFTNSYPKAGHGGWSQFMINEVQIDETYI